MVHKDLTNPHYVRWKSFLSRAQHWSADQIKTWQLQKLREVISKALLTPGYRRKFEAAELKTLEDIRNFPTTSKYEMMKNVEDFTLECGDYVTTGGTTGHPFGFYRSWLAFSRELASKAHQYERVGWKEGDRQIVFRGLVLDNLIVEVPELFELRCSSYHLDEEHLSLFVEAAWKYRPLWLKCYPSAGYLLAKLLEATGLEFPPLKGILLASENVYDFQLEKLKKVFGCTIFSHYGHYECAALAGWCKYTTDYHVLPFYGYVELLRPGTNTPVTEPGEVGEIVATSFIMDATLFVRYRTGDLAVYKGEGCSKCGLPYQIWERVEGRELEFIVTSKGRLIPLTCINMHDDVFDAFWQFQLRQRTPGVVEFHFVPRLEGKALEKGIEKARKALSAKLPDTHLLFRKVNEIPRTGRGKHKFLVQELKLPF
mgnify:CR=1 FL=1